MVLSRDIEEMDDALELSGRIVEEIVWWLGAETGEILRSGVRDRDLRGGSACSSLSSGKGRFDV